MSHMFLSAKSFNQPLEFNTENVIKMKCMFFGAILFNKPLNFNTENLTNVLYMYLGCPISEDNKCTS